MSDDPVKNYLLDLGSIVKEKAMGAAITKSENPEAYNLGYLMAWHEIVSLEHTSYKSVQSVARNPLRFAIFPFQSNSRNVKLALMQSQATQFNIDLQSISLEGIDPERDLL